MGWEAWRDGEGHFYYLPLRDHQQAQEKTKDMKLLTFGTLPTSGMYMYNNVRVVVEQLKFKHHR